MPHDFALAGQTWVLVHVPSWLLIIAIMAVCIGVTLLGLWIVRKNVGVETLEAHHDVAGFILGVVGVVYAVLLAFLVVIVWQQFDEARSDANREATVLLAVYRDAVELQDTGADARPALRLYAKQVVDTEWDEMAEHHQESRTADQALNQAWTAFRAMHPTGDGDGAFYDDAVAGLHEVSELRRTRIDASGAKLVGAMWAMLIVGGAISIAFTYFFGVKSFAAQALMVSALAALVGLVLALILSLDLPFTGGVAVQPSAMRGAITEFAHIDSDLR